jgi:hypothetical protein
MQLGPLCIVPGTGLQVHVRAGVRPRPPIIWRQRARRGAWNARAFDCAATGRRGPVAAARRSGFPRTEIATQDEIKPLK